MKKNGKFQPGVSGNDAAKWRPGQSGNPAGKSRLRTQFEEAFNEALTTEGSPQEASKLLWAAARRGEPWAVQEVCRRFAPETRSLQLIHEVENVRVDWSRLTGEQIEQLERILEQAEASPAIAEDGESPPQPS
jgi:hypothetical protein